MTSFISGQVMEKTFFSRGLRFQKRGRRKGACEKISLKSKNKVYGGQNKIFVFFDLSVDIFGGGSSIA